MRPGGGKSKGASFERLICEQLSRWVDPDGEETHFWRSAMSGGRATVRHKKGKKTDSQSSDISAITAHGIPLLSCYSIECKFVKTLELTTAAISAKGPLAQFWEQVSKDAKRHGKKPMLIAKQNMWPALVFMKLPDAANCFGPVSDLELASFKGFHTALSMFRLCDLLDCGYVKGRFE